MQSAYRRLMDWERRVAEEKKKDDLTPGEMTDEQLAVAREWFSRFSGPRSCPVCNNNDTWVVLPRIVAAPAFGKGIYLAGNVMPLFPIVCKTCSYTLFMNARFAGVVKDADPPKEEGGQGG